MSKEIVLPWGGEGNISFKLPQKWNLRAVLEPAHPPVISDVVAETEKVLNNPIGMPPLKEFARGKKKACVLIDDRTRPTPVHLILPGVIKELNMAGVEDSNITILITLGTHREMTAEEIKERVGAEIVSRLKVINHNFMDKSQNVHVGVTPTHKIPVTFNKLVVEADIVVSIGCIEAHEQAGVGGGYKNFMPGVAGPEPIYATHTAKFQKPLRISSAGCPKEMCRFRQAVDEAGALLGPKVFIVNAVLDPVNPVALVAGDPIKAHEEGRKIYEKMAGVKLDEPADIVIADARPLDCDLRVSMKAWFNASPALKKGGLFITVSAVPDGLGDLRVPDKLPKGAKTLIRKIPLAVLEPIATRINTSPDQSAGTISLMKLLKTVSNWFYLCSMPDGVPALRAMGITFFKDIETLIREAEKVKPSGDVVVLPHAGASFIAWS